MRTELRKPFSHGFVLTEQELRRVYDTMLQQMKRLTKEDNITNVFELKFKNGVIAEKASVDEIISENNSGKWEIQELKMGMVSKIRNEDVQIGIEFRKINSSTSKDNTHGSIYYYILGDERDWVYLTSSQLDERIVKTKQNPMFIWCELIAIIIGVFLLLPSIDAVLHPENYNFPVGDKIVAFLITGLIITGGIAGIYGFPAYNFCWGDYLKIFNNRRTVGKFIIITVIIGIVVGVIGGIISNYLSQKIGVGH